MKDELKSGFKTWLSENKRCEAEIASILDNLDIVDIFLNVMYGLKSVFTNRNGDGLAQLKKRLFSDQQFEKLNKKRDNNLSDALNELFKFLLTSTQNKTTKQPNSFIQDTDANDQSTNIVMPENDHSIVRSPTQLPFGTKDSVQVDRLDSQLHEKTDAGSHIVNGQEIGTAMEDESSSSFIAWLSKNKYSLGECGSILGNLAIVDTYTSDVYGSKHVFEYRNSDELNHIRKRLIEDKQFNILDKENAYRLLRAFNQYFVFLHISEKEKAKQVVKQSITFYKGLKNNNQTSDNVIPEIVFGLKYPLAKTSVEKEFLPRVDFSKTQLCERTVPVSCIINGKKLTAQNWARLFVAITEMFIAYKNPNVVSLYKQSLSQQHNGFPFFMKNRIDGLNCAQLYNGYWINVNYNIPRLVDLIGRLCVHCSVNLKDVIINYSAKSSDNHPKNVLITPALGINDKTVKENIPYRGVDSPFVKDRVVKYSTQAQPSILNHRGGNTDIIALPNGRFLQRSDVVDLEEAADTLLKILQKQFRQFDGYSNHRLLFDAARIDLSMFMNDNAFENEATIYAIAKHLFSKENYGSNRFVFYGNTHIWESAPDYPMNLRGIIMHRARLNGGRITRVECEVFLNKIMLGQGNYSQAVQSGGDSTFYQYASGEFILSEILQIDKAWQEKIKRAIDELFIGNYFVIPRDIVDSWYEKLPKLPPGLTWTPLLLQEVLRYNPAIGFKSVFAPLEQSKDTVAAAFLPANSDLTFADVVSAHLAKTMDLPKRMSTEELRFILRDAGMIEGNELIYNIHKALNDYRFALSDGNKTVYIHKG